MTGSSSSDDSSLSSDPSGSGCAAGRVVKGVGHLDHVGSYGVREVVSSIPGPGQYSRMSFSSDPGDWYGFLI